jgi:hypothetical protein
MNSAGGTLESGRSVMTHSDGWCVSCECQQNVATIRTRGHRIIVAPAAVIIDRHVRVPIDDDAQEVVIKVFGDKITLIADGDVVADRAL